jgi:hypothetical protein
MDGKRARTIAGSAETAEAASVLLRELIDYAGLFPPTSLSMAASVANYDAYLQSEWSWILGRFIVPAARLGEFEDALNRLPRPAPEGRAVNWRLSALLGSDPVQDLACIHAFNARVTNYNAGRRSGVESVEVKVAHPVEIVKISPLIPAELAAYFEFPFSSCSACIAALAQCGHRAKMRMGGETEDKFPCARNVIEFIRLCAAANAPFKATAGLHHPLRSTHRFTYQPDSPSGMMHGFLNVFLAAAFLRTGMDADSAVDLLEERSAQAFRYDVDGAGWREHRLSRNELAAARREFSISFGSCSFTEPIDDLRLLNLL